MKPTALRIITTGGERYPMVCNKCARIMAGHEWVRSSKSITIEQWNRCSRCGDLIAEKNSQEVQQ